MNRKISFCLIITIILCASCRREEMIFETEWLRLGVSSEGYLTTVYDRKGAVEYLPGQHKTPLVTLYKAPDFILPEAASFVSDSGIIRLDFGSGSKATIKAENKGSYLRFELLSLEPRNGVEAVIWGPLATTISDKIGETVCVVRDTAFAFGMQALNLNTIEGLPDGDDNTGGGGVIEPLPGQALPDSLKDRIGQKTDVNVNVTGDMPEYVRLYRGSAAVKMPFGSELRLFSRDRRTPRVIKNWLGNKDYVQYAEAIDADLTGSAVAVFGCPEPQALDFIEKIELGEGLPHPMLDGVWIKRSSFPGEAYLLNEGDPIKSLRYARECGFRLVHIGDIFNTWGHFNYSGRRFPGGLKEIRAAVREAKNDGISMGVHTLTMFTQKNDPYVSPVPSDSLCKTGSSVLVSDITAEDGEIFVEDPVYFRYPGNTHTVKIGKELINYRKISDSAPWKLLDCRRGEFGTAAGSHKKGAVVDKLTNDSYSGFYPDIRLQDTYAVRLAQVCNETGVDLMDFDGYAGESPTGHGSYGAARFIDLWYRNLDRYRLTCGAGTFHYYWHIYAFMNWGEPWYNALRESQVNYRIENQRYFERNLMPGMLGWFTLNPEFRPEEVEWIQARSAAFDAGYLLRVDESVEKNGFRNELFSVIREWQKARHSKAFSAAQTEAMKNPKNEFHLEKTGEGTWDLYPVNLARGYVHRYREVQTGEPVTTKFEVNNPYEEQPLQFYLSATGGSGKASSSVSGIRITINNYQTLDLKISISQGERIMCDGKKIFLCDNTWNRLKVIYEGKIPVFEKGKSEIIFSSEFSGPDAPALSAEFKSAGKPEQVKEAKL